MATITTQSTVPDISSRKRRLSHDETQFPRPAKRNSIHLMPKSLADTDIDSRQSLVQSGSQDPLPNTQPNDKPHVTNGHAPPLYSAMSTSPVSNTLSQTSVSSYTAASPSTAASSIVHDDETNSTSATAGRNLSSQPILPNVQQSMVKENGSRSPSVISLDGGVRSSARTRKPTTKAQALADAGTRFYRNLHRLSDGLASEGSPSPSRLSEPTPEKDDLPQIVDTNNHAKDILPEATNEASVVASVESPSSTAVRSSSRQRKPTLKAVAAETDLSTRKRTASPLSSDRPNKISKTGTSTPRGPSKLRRSLSLPDNSVEKATRSASSLPQTVSQKAAASPTPTQIPTLDDSAAPNSAKLALDSWPVESDTCDLSCMSPATILLAFARYAAQESTSAGSDNNFEEDQPDFENAASSGKGTTKMSKDVIESIIRPYCSCTNIHAGTIVSNDQTNELLDESRIRPTQARDSPRTGLDASQSQTEIAITDPESASRARSGGRVKAPATGSQNFNVGESHSTSVRECEGLHDAASNKHDREQTSQASAHMDRKTSSSDNSSDSLHSTIQPYSSATLQAEKKTPPRRPETIPTKKRSSENTGFSPLKRTSFTNAKITRPPMEGITQTASEQTLSSGAKRSRTSIVLKTAANKNSPDKEGKSITKASPKPAMSREQHHSQSKMTGGKSPEQSQKTSPTENTSNHTSKAVPKSENSKSARADSARTPIPKNTPSLKITLKVRALPK